VGEVVLKMLTRKEKQDGLVGRFEIDVEEAFKKILMSLSECFGVNIWTNNFAETPRRVAKAYSEIFDGLVCSSQRVEEILAKTFPGKNDEMVSVGPVHVWSMCPHHFLPVEMNVWVAYLPSGKILGLSKLARLAELVAKKPALQEDTTTEISELLMKHLEPAGAACLVRGRHLCMEMRGVKKSAITTTTSLLGAFKNPATREEFLRSVNGC